MSTGTEGQDQPVPAPVPVPGSDAPEVAALKQTESARVATAQSGVSSEFNYSEDFESSGGGDSKNNTQTLPAGGGSEAGSGDPGAGGDKGPAMRGPPPPAAELASLPPEEEPPRPVIKTTEEEASELLAMNPQEVSSAAKKPDDLEGHDMRSMLHRSKVRLKTFRALAGVKSALTPLRRIFDKLADPENDCVSRLHFTNIIKGNAAIQPLLMEPVRVNIESEEEEILADVIYDMEDDGAGDMHFPEMCSYFGYEWSGGDEMEHAAGQGGGAPAAPVVPELRIPTPEPAEAAPAAATATEAMSGQYRPASGAELVMQAMQRVFYRLDEASPSSGRDQVDRLALVGSLRSVQALRPLAGEPARDIPGGGTDTFSDVFAGMEEDGPGLLSFALFCGYFGLRAQDMAPPPAEADAPPLEGYRALDDGEGSTRRNMQPIMAEFQRLSELVKSSRVKSDALISALWNNKAVMARSGELARAHLGTGDVQTFGEVLVELERLQGEGGGAGQEDLSLEEFLAFFGMVPAGVPSVESMGWVPTEAAAALAKPLVGLLMEVCAVSEAAAGRGNVATDVARLEDFSGAVDRAKLVGALRNNPDGARNLGKEVRRRVADDKTETLADVLARIEDGDGEGAISLPQFLAHFSLTPADVPWADDSVAGGVTPRTTGYKLVKNDANTAAVNALASLFLGLGQTPRGKVDRLELLSIVKGTPAVGALVKKPARVRLADGKKETWAAVYQHVQEDGPGLVTLPQFLAYWGVQDDDIPTRDTGLMAPSPQPPQDGLARGAGGRVPLSAGGWGDEADEGGWADDGSLAALAEAEKSARGPSRGPSTDPSRGASAEGARPADAEGGGGEAAGGMRYDDEASLLKDLQGELASDLDGAAKLVIVGGMGASQSQRSVFRFWPRVWQRHIDNSARHVVALADRGFTSLEDSLPPPPSEREEFERESGASYLLGDMHVLDLGTLHWSRPTTTGAFAPPRAGHSATFFPTRIDGEELQVAVAGPGVVIDSDGPVMHMGSVQVSSLIGHLAGIVLGAGGGMLPSTLGRVVLETLAYDLRKLTALRGAEGTADDVTARELLGTLLTLCEAEIKAHAPADLAFALPKDATVERVLARCDGLEPPKADGSRSIDALKQTLARDANFVKALPGAVCAAAKRTTGTSTTAVVRVEEISISAPPPGLDQVWVVVELAAHPVSRGMSREVPFREEGEREWVGFEKVYSLGDGDVRDAFTSIVEGKATPEVLLKVQGSLEEDGGEGGAAAPIDLGFAQVSLATVMDSMSDVMSARLDVLGQDGTVMGGVQVSVLAARCLGSLMRAQRRAYMDSFDLAVFGGRSAGERRKDMSVDLAAMNDLVMYDAAANKWITVPPAGGSIPPAPRYNHAAVRHGTKLWIFGGTDGKSHFNDIRCVDVLAGASRGTWSEPPTAGITPRARCGHSGTLVEAAGPGGDGTWIVYHGGGDEGGNLDDVQILDVSDSVVKESGPRWLLPTISGTPPPKRRGHAAALMRAGVSDASSNAWALYTFGGRVSHVEKREIDGAVYVINQDTTSNALHCLKPVVSDDPYQRTLLRLEWTVPKVRGRLPPPREAASMVAVGQKLIVSHGWAGVEKAPWMRDFWIIDLVTLTWCSLAFSDNYPSARFGAGVALCDYRQSVAKNATLYGRALQRDSLGALFVEVEAGQTVELGLQARDVRGLPAERRGDIFSAQLLAPSRPGSRPGSKARSRGSTPRVGSGGLSQEARVVDGKDGTYSLAFCPVQSGETELHITGEAGIGVRKSPVRVVVLPGAVSAKRCTVGGRGLRKLTPGEQTEIVLCARDAFGNLAGVAPGDFEVSLSGPEKPALVAEAGEAGQLVYKVTVTRAGEYNLVCKHAPSGVHLSGSPYTIECSAGASWAQESTAVGRALGGRWHAGLKAVFTVTARDVFGNKRTKGGDKFDVKFQTTLTKGIMAPEEPGHVKDNGNGTYTVSLLPAESGTCIVSVTSANEEDKGNHISKSPFTLDVSSGLISPAHCIVSGLGATGQAGELTEFSVTSRDKLGNPLGGGNDHVFAWAVPLQGDKHKLDCEVVDRGDGTYQCRLMPRSAGPHMIHIEAMCGFSDNPSRGAVGRSPFAMEVLPGPTDPYRSTAQGTGVYGLGKARTPAQVVVTARDRFGNQRPEGGDAIAVQVWCGWDVPVDLVDNGDGTYVGTYYTGEEEEYTGRMKYVVSVTVGGHHVINSPFYHSIAPTPTAAKMSEVVDLPPLLTAGETAEFTLQAVDEDGRRALKGMDNFTLQVLGNDSAYGDVKDLKNGSYLVRIIAEEKAYYQVQVRLQLDGINVRGSPFNITVVPTGLFNVGFWGGFRMMDEEAAESFMLTGAGLVHASAGQRAEFDILSKRVQEATAGEDFSLELRGPEFVPGVVEGPEDGGVYRATYCATQAGTYVGTVKLGRFQLHGCPFQLTVFPSVTSPAHCELSGAGLSQCVATVEADFLLSTFDMHGNSTCREDDTFEVHIKGGGKVGKGKAARWQKAEVMGSFDSNQDGTYTLRYTVPFEGSFSVEVFHSTGPGKPLVLCKGCPYNVQASKAPREERPVVDDAERRRLDKIEAQEAAVKAAMRAAADAAGGQERMEEMAGRNTEASKNRGGGIFGRMRQDSVGSGGGKPGTAAAGPSGRRSGAGAEQAAEQEGPVQLFPMGFWSIGAELLQQVAREGGGGGPGGAGAAGLSQDRVKIRRQTQHKKLQELTDDFLKTGPLGGRPPSAAAAAE